MGDSLSVPVSTETKETHTDIRLPHLTSSDEYLTSPLPNEEPSQLAGSSTSSTSGNSITISTQHRNLDTQRGMQLQQMKQSEFCKDSFVNEFEFQQIDEPISRLIGPNKTSPGSLQQVDLRFCPQTIVASSYENEFTIPNHAVEYDRLQFAKIEQRAIARQLARKRTWGKDDDKSKELRRDQQLRDLLQGMRSLERKVRNGRRSSQHNKSLMFKSSVRKAQNQIAQAESLLHWMGSEAHAKYRRVKTDLDDALGRLALDIKIYVQPHTDVKFHSSYERDHHPNEFKSVREIEDTNGRLTPIDADQLLDEEARAFLNRFERTTHK